MRKINWNSELHQRWNFARGQNEQIQQPARTFNVLHLLYLSIVFINQYQSLNSCMIRLLFSILYLGLILQHLLSFEGAAHILWTLSWSDGVSYTVFMSFLHRKKLNQFVWMLLLSAAKRSRTIFAQFENTLKYVCWCF